MIKYATKQSFGGQRVSIGRVVNVKRNGEILAADVVEIDSQDRPVLRAKHAWAGKDSVLDGLPFADPKTEEDLEVMPDRVWFFPVRL